MAEVVETLQSLEHYPYAGELWHIEWNSLKLNDTGRPISLAEFADRSIQIYGTLDGALAVIEGSNQLVNPTNWFTLTGSNGAALSLSAIGVGHILLEPCVWVRPRMQGGGASTNVTFQLFVKRVRSKQ